MIAIILSWFIITIIFLSFGSLLILLYQKYTNRKEKYTYVDTFILGMFTVTLLISLTSIFVPSNHFILLILFIISITYWGIRKNKLREYISTFKSQIKALSVYEKIYFICTSISFIFILVWVSDSFDSVYYHYQAIRWNEDYAVIPGLANIEDRLGFNSNYMLISAVFTFSFLFEEPVYTLLSLVVFNITICIIYICIISKYEIKRVILLVLWALLIILTHKILTDTSTDIIPNVLIFYLTAKIILDPDALKSKLLLFIITPIALITFKVSAIIFSAIVIYPIIICIKSKNFKTLIFSGVFASVLVLAWCIRNIILSGYLIYPLYQLDFFSFDWEVPLAVLQKQVDYIKEIGQVSLFRNTKLFYYRDFNILDMRFLNNVVFLLTAISYIVVAYYYIWKKRKPDLIFFIYLILLTCTIYWFVTAPDIRFNVGIFFGTIYLASCLLTNSLNINNIEKKHGAIFIASFSSLLFICSAFRSYDFYYNNLKFNIPENKNKSKSPLSVLITPFSFKNQIPFHNNSIEYGTFKIGEITIYTINESWYILDKIPCVSLNFEYHNFQDITTIENRGETIQEGFRSKNKFN